jgi:cell fate regulator YaaT (PSP1 superfamily)
MDKQHICYTRGCFNPSGELPEKEMKSLICCNKLDTLDWLEDIPFAGAETDIIEIRFKNTRKGYYKNVNKIKLRKGDIVAVEASPGHDIGIVCLTGELVRTQMKRNGVSFTTEEEIKKVYRKAKGVDIEKWYQAIDLEMPSMLKARQIAARLNLDMKIGDVEYQGDKTKAIFYYIADDRVDFRELIKIYAEEFRVRIEMKQIGARQEAGRIGGIGTCGRELCCSSWLTNFISVTTNAARYQEVSLNPQKLAGQCGKLKCCLNYELKCYLDAQQDFPDTAIPLEIFDGTAYHQKTDIFRRLMWYSFTKDEAANMVAVPVERVIEILEQNKNGIKVKSLVDVSRGPVVEKALDYHSPIGTDSVTRFEDNQRDRRKKKKKHRNPNQNQTQGQGQVRVQGQKQNPNPARPQKQNPNQNNHRGNENKR